MYQEGWSGFHFNDTRVTGPQHLFTVANVWLDNGSRTQMDLDRYHDIYKRHVDYYYGSLFKPYGTGRENCLVFLAWCCTEQLSVIDSPVMTKVCGTPASLSSRWMWLLYRVRACPFPLCGFTRSIIRRGRDKSLTESPTEGEKRHTMYDHSGKEKDQWLISFMIYVSLYFLY